jgi:hypothetical protein
MFGGGVPNLGRRLYYAPERRSKPAIAHPYGVGNPCGLESGSASIMKEPLREWRNWQTRKT